MNTLAQRLDSNGKQISLVPEREENLVEKAGYFFPKQVDSKTLFVTGVSGTGKTTFVREVCSKTGLNYRNDQAIVLFEERFPLYHRFGFPSYFGVSSLFDLDNQSIIDGHFMFNSQDILEDYPFFAHSSDFINSEKSTIDFNFNLLEMIRNDFVFEFRHFSPREILRFREKRMQNESRSYFHDGIIHGNPNQNILNIHKSSNFLLDVAYFLHSQGADVYIRDDLKGIPLRFKE